MTPAQALAEIDRVDALADPSKYDLEARDLACAEIVEMMRRANAPTESPPPLPDPDAWEAQASATRAKYDRGEREPLDAREPIERAVMAARLVVAVNMPRERERLEVVAAQIRNAIVPVLHVAGAFHRDDEPELHEAIDQLQRIASALAGGLGASWHEGR